MTRDELIIAVRVAIWDALEEYVDMGYVDRTRGIIDTGMADDLDMNKVAEAAINEVFAAIPIYPQWEMTAPGSFEISQTYTGDGSGTMEFRSGTDRRAE